MKTKIVGILLACRTMNDGVTFELNQERILRNLSSTWGEARPAALLHHNDRVRVYGIVMSLPSNREMYDRLAAGASKNRALVDNPIHHLKEIYQSIRLSFNNHDIELTLPTDALDIIGIEQIDANDNDRIRITRDCKYIV